MADRNREFGVRQRLGNRPKTGNWFFGAAFVGALIGVGAAGSEIGILCVAVICGGLGALYAGQRQKEYDREFRRLMNQP